MQKVGEGMVNIIHEWRHARSNLIDAVLSLARQSIWSSLFSTSFMWWIFIPRPNIFQARMLPCNNWIHSISLSQRMEMAKDLVFPSRVLKRQLEDAQLKLREMEEELETIKNKEQRERKRRKKTRVWYVPVHPSNEDTSLINTLCTMVTTR